MSETKPREATFPVVTAPNGMGLVVRCPVCGAAKAIRDIPETDAAREWAMFEAKHRAEHGLVWRLRWGERYPERLWVYPENATCVQYGCEQLAVMPFVYSHRRAEQFLSSQDATIAHPDIVLCRGGLANIRDGVWPVWLCRRFPEPEPEPGALFVWSEVSHPETPWWVMRRGYVVHEDDPLGIQEAAAEYVRKRGLAPPAHDPLVRDPSEGETDRVAQGVQPAGRGGKP